jgi:sugar lactone lactonase YvrE
VVLLTVALPFLGACSGNGSLAPEWQDVATFEASADLPRIVVYGSLAPHLPRFQPTTGLDEFLYGPAPVPNDLLRNPQGLARLGNKLLVCDQGHFSVIGVNLATGITAEWQDRDRPPRCPVAITVGENGSVYVADTTLLAVLVYGPAGEFVERLAPGENPDPTFRPASLLIRDGVLFIGNIGGRRVDRWDLAERQWLSPIVPPGDENAFVAPTGLAMTAEGVLLIVDSVRGRVFRVTADGQWLRPVGRPGRQEGQFVRPKQVCATLSGLIFVTDAGRQSVLAFTAQGDYLTEIREQPENWRGFTQPAGLLSLPADGLDALMPEGRPVPEPRPDEWVIVSDTLSGASLNVLGIFLPEPMEAAPNAE